MTVLKEKIGLFYGTDTGYTEGVALQIKESFDPEIIELYNIAEAEKRHFRDYNFIIIGLSTWHDGELQSDWESFFNDFKTIDFEGKTVAFFGLGDQTGYPEYFIDGVGILAEVVYENGGNIVGVWPTEGYSFEASKAVFQDGWFFGLAIDEDNQPDLTIDRVEIWTRQLKEEFLEVVNSMSL